MKKSVLSFLLGIALIGTQWVSVSAMDNSSVVRYETADSVEIMEFGEIVMPSYNSLSKSNITLTGKLNGINPVFVKPSATASSKTTAIVYAISAQVSVNNNGQGTASGPKVTLNNTTKVTSVATS
jgi:hypothetical protein